MTEWYSPKDKLPKLENYKDEISPFNSPDTSVWVYGALIEPNKAPVYLDTYYVYKKEIWLTHDSYRMPSPTYWCYLPEVPQELIDKLKEQ